MSRILLSAIVTLDENDNASKQYLLS